MWPFSGTFKIKLFTTTKHFTIEAPNLAQQWAYWTFSFFNFFINVIVLQSCCDTRAQLMFLRLNANKNNNKNTDADNEEILSCWSRDSSVAIPHLLGPDRTVESTKWENYRLSYCSFISFSLSANGKLKGENEKVVLAPCLPVSRFLPPSLCCPWQMSPFLSIFLRIPSSPPRCHK